MNILNVSFIVLHLFNSVSETSQTTSFDYCIQTCLLTFDMTYEALCTGYDRAMMSGQSNLVPSSFQGILIIGVAFFIIIFIMRRKKSVDNPADRHHMISENKDKTH